MLHNANRAVELALGALRYTREKALWRNSLGQAEYEKAAAIVEAAVFKEKVTQKSGSSVVKSCDQVWL